jgi:hypothetical protein
MSELGPTVTPFVGSDRRFEVLERLAAKARAKPLRTLPEPVTSCDAASIRAEGKEDFDKELKDMDNSSDTKDIVDAIKTAEEQRKVIDDKPQEDQKAIGDKQAKEHLESKEAKEYKEDEEKTDHDTKDLKDSKDRDKETFKEDLEKSPKEAEERKGLETDKEGSEKSTDKDAKEAAEKSADKEAAEKSGDKEVSEKDKEGEKEASDKDGDIEIGTEESSTFDDPVDRRLLTESGASGPRADAVTRPTSLLRHLPVV